MKCEIVVFNDRNVTMRLQVQSTDADRYTNVKPQSVIKITFDIPRKSVPYLKVWETGQALLSYILHNDCKDIEIG